MADNTKETEMPKLTSEVALEYVTRIEDLKNQISLVYRDIGDRFGAGEINLIRDIVNYREEAADQKTMADGLLEALDEEDED